MEHGPVRVDLPSGVIKHGWLENPRTQWRYLARKINDIWSIFQHAMFDDTGGYLSKSGGLQWWSRWIPCQIASIFSVVLDRCMAAVYPKTKGESIEIRGTPHQITISNDLRLISNNFQINSS